MTRMVATTNSPRERELRGRGTRRYQLPMHDDSNAGPNPSGLCMCGCGRVTPLATQNDPRNGIKKGQHRRYCKSHHLRGVPRTEDVKRRISVANSAKTGSSTSQWNGGVQRRRGRRYLLVAKDHPMATKSGYVADYRLAMSEALGRPLLEDEHVHHIDLDQTNNQLSNLVVLSRSAHMRLHRLIDKRGLSPFDALVSAIQVERS